MELDYGVGVILAKLRELQVEQNTFVFFSSDNGAEGNINNSQIIDQISELSLSTVKHDMNDIT